MKNATVSRKKTILLMIISFIAGLLVMLLALELVIPAISSKDDKYGIVPEEISAKTPEWFTYQRTYSNKTACVDISFNENPSKPVYNEDFSDNYGWFYTIYLTETNGIEFYPESYTEYFFSDGYSTSEFSYGADDLITWWGESRVPANDMRIVTGGMPLQDLSGIGIVVSGKDAKGNELEFSDYLEFSHEIPNN